VVQGCTTAIFLRLHSSADPAAPASPIILRIFCPFSTFRRRTDFNPFRRLERIEIRSTKQRTFTSPLELRGGTITATRRQGKSNRR
jgi:hypothetical protein